MNSAASHSVTPKELLRAFRERRRLWVVPTIVCTAVGVVSALAMSRKWEATQAIIVRQEAVGAGEQRPGSFSSIEEMKKTQETILEIAKSRSVLVGALTDVGPPPSLLKWGQWPAESDVDGLSRNIRMTPPGGAEFGMTEVAYLAVRSEDSERALALLTALCGHLERQFMKVRDERAQSVLVELQKTVALAEADLQKATTELAAFEATVGADLTELRMLLEASAGTSDVRQTLVAIENSKQEYTAQLRQQTQLLEMLAAAKDDPSALIATPNSLLDAQPALRRLKEGLIEAQLHTSRLLGRRSAGHPEVIAAQFAEEEVRENLRRELGTAIRGVEVDMKISGDRLAGVDEEIVRSKARLKRLAGKRAQYANLVAATENRAQVLEQARMRLAEAQASQASARGASLIGRLDAPHVGANPVGPGRLVIAATGLVGGLAIGVALVCLCTVPAPSVMFGRRKTDHLAADVAKPEPVTSAAPAADALGTTPKAAEFGMFQGKTLRQAVDEIRQRDEREVPQSAESPHA